MQKKQRTLIILWTVFFLYKEISIGGRWERAGIISIHNLCHDTKYRLLSHIEIRNHIGVACTILDTLRLRMGIPGHWHTMLTVDFQGDPSSRPEVHLPSRKAFSILGVPARKLYAELVLIGRPALQPKGNGIHQSTFQTLKNGSPSTPILSR